ncbi:cyclic pyranopterin monophosphate synthase MoaC [Jatrophihabitans endophyticus]|uniref:cyclic pyranopterin monophosphate synthase MoaC n=1 Tax=Jatrophihabitans endophyticus TaxID=1206085 RepID=UPI001F282C66|nr:cyclic pyranopterin monophosphate synthase MoaC [Jatrophihabitans endophyticus]
MSADDHAQGSPARLTHVDDHGAARMVDVSAKDVTTRTATAAGRFETTPEVIALLRRDGLPKGDALAVARIAGIAAAKRTSDLVPLCHPVALHAVSVELEVGADAVDIAATTRTADRTGVEMEALTSVVAAGLALYDMVKAVDRGARLTDVRLVAKAGGRSGAWHAGGTGDTAGATPASPPQRTPGSTSAAVGSAVGSPDGAAPRTSPGPS